jgi:hypothetical protein
MRRLGCLFAIGMMWLCIVDCFSQGLLFYGNEKRISERATYSVLREGHERTFTNAFRISFDYLVRNVESPGYILYLEDRDAGKTYSFTYLHKPGDRVLSPSTKTANVSFVLSNWIRKTMITAGCLFP